MQTIINTITNRSSKRAYLAKPVARDIQEKILKAAQMTPSGANMQPWITYAISDTDVLKNIGDAIIDKMNSGVEHEQFIQYYPLNWVAPYKKRRLETGVGLYKLMGVDRKDYDTRTKMWHNNFRWFGAQTVFFIFTDKANIDGAQGALIDCGAYMQTIMLAAQEFGVDSCPQGSTTEFGKVVADVLNTPENLALLYSVVLGYEDKDAKINSYKPERVPLSETVTFI
ncbi:MAG: nitroreductase [Sulfurimonas sp.]|uniref:nitroreductase n=1 Tax=Sulfurimonas sp. TaxID=2022749 RepID=UPI00261E3773|nr:nitroreductase [Sulfurimonas sp.]MCW8895965.1 nitroreductase [Sulfurimonas sp.]MCW8954788.1 nitroreductase [Sulfurimonas sp.]MCW9067026.1 nitroreductase [Sulfurimonas sp.]